LLEQRNRRPEIALAKPNDCLGVQDGSKAPPVLPRLARLDRLLDVSESASEQPQFGQHDTEPRVREPVVVECWGLPLRVPAYFIQVLLIDAPRAGEIPENVMSSPEVRSGPHLDDDVAESRADREGALACFERCVIFRQGPSLACLEREGEPEATLIADLL